MFMFQATSVLREAKKDSAKTAEPKLEPKGVVKISPAEKKIRNDVEKQLGKDCPKTVVEAVIASGAYKDKKKMTDIKNAIKEIKTRGGWERAADLAIIFDANLAAKLVERPDIFIGVEKATKTVRKFDLDDTSHVASAVISLKNDTIWNFFKNYNALANKAYSSLAKLNFGFDVLRLNDDLAKWLAKDTQGAVEAFSKLRYPYSVGVLANKEMAKLFMSRTDSTAAEINSMARMYSEGGYSTDKFSLKRNANVLYTMIKDEGALQAYLKHPGEFVSILETAHSAYAPRTDQEAWACPLKTLELLSTEQIRALLDAHPREMAEFAKNSKGFLPEVFTELATDPKLFKLMKENPDMMLAISKACGYRTSKVLGMIDDTQLELIRKYPDAYKKALRVTEPSGEGPSTVPEYVVPALGTKGGKKMFEDFAKGKTDFETFQNELWEYMKEMTRFR